MESRREFPDEYKREAVRRSTEPGVTKSQVARKEFTVPAGSPDSCRGDRLNGCDVLRRVRSSMSGGQLLHVFRSCVPGVDELNPDQIVVHVLVTEQIGAEAGAYREVVRSLVMQREAEIPNVEILSHLDAIHLRLEAGPIPGPDRLACLGIERLQGGGRVRIRDQDEQPLGQDGEAALPNVFWSRSASRRQSSAPS